MFRRKYDYRHIICILITLGFACVSIFVFQNSFGRLIEAFRDFGLSFAFFFCEMFNVKYSFTPTVDSLPKIPFFDGYGGNKSPTTSLPDSYGGFKVKWSEYWKLFISKDNITSYLSSIANVVYYVALILIIFSPLLILLIYKIKSSCNKFNNDYNIDSKPLKVFKIISKHTYVPLKSWIIDFVGFVRSHKVYYIIWLCLWLYNFNVFTIVVEFIAYIYYFAGSFNLNSVYLQFYKLGLDLWSAFSFIPIWCWVIVAIIVLELICRKIAYERLYHRERRNRGFINERGVVTIVLGAMGVGKTMQITDMALSTEVQFRDQAFEIILETDMKFPFFPWINLENALKIEIEEHRVFDIWKCRKWIRNLKDQFIADVNRDNIFDYDFERYGLYYNDKLKVVDIWEALEDYACAYLIYTVQSSLLVSNYSIRSDMLFADLGNFPLWNGDFFKRDSRLMDSYSRHAHILDFDMLRLGKTMIEYNPNKNAFGFGVYIISEIDKERKNTLELTGIKANSPECNQKNDLFNVLLKMSRHACVVANKVFVKIFADLQRPDSLGVDSRELGDMINIVRKGENSIVLPFFAPFYLINLLISWLYGKFQNYYVSYRYNRADNTLLLYVFKTITAKLKHYVERTTNTFGSQILTVEVESSLVKGDLKRTKYFRQSKKIYSKRYSTDCLSGIFEARSEDNFIGLDDLKEYADIMATYDELGLQNSHFQTEINNLRN